MSAAEPVDEWGPARARGIVAPPLLQQWNEADALAAPDVHLAVQLGALAGESDNQVLLACALAVRAVREGSVCLDLAAVSVPADVDLPALPDAAEGAHRVRASHLVGEDRPWVWDQDRLYLHRHLSEERQAAADLLERDRPVPVDAEVLSTALDEAYGAGGDGAPGRRYADQRQAVETACRHRTAIITGGPGSGKTTTLAQLIGVLVRLQAAQHPDDPPLRIHLAAPTGKAAARMAQSVRSIAEAEGFGFPDLRERLSGLPATTVHRLLGSLPGQRSRFKHDRSQRLPVDVVVVDEASMLSLTLMARLLEALRPDARLVLLGDADQLASVEAGAVLTDLVEGLERRADPPVARLSGSRRFSGAISELAWAVRDGDTESVLSRLEAAGPEGADGVRWVPQDGAPGAPGARQLQAELLAYAERLAAAAAGGDRASSLEALAGFRLLCAHREGPYGAAAWNRQALRLLGSSTGRRLPLWYAGRPVIVERNDPALGLFNGDTAIAVAEPGRALAGGLAGVIDDGTALGRRLALARLAETQPAYAMTVHRAQGSQFAHVAVLLPEVGSQVLTRQLLYTALTRATTQVTVVGGEESVAAAVGRAAGRATLLASRL